MTTTSTSHPIRRCRYLHIGSREHLAALYMPFVKHGGLFIPTDDALSMGDRLFLLVRILDETQPVPVCATVVWLTPPKVHGGYVAGAGVQFHEHDGTLRRRIEERLSTTPVGRAASLTL